MFVELHILQNFAFSNLNRDLSGAPKDCDFGGYRRARISSQCIKRAIRDQFRGGQIIPKDNIGERTKQLLKYLTECLVGANKAEDEARQVAEVALKGMKLGIEKDGKTQYLLFLGRAEMQGLVNVCLQHWGDLLDVAASQSSAAGKPASSKEAKKASRQAVPPDVLKALEAVLDGGRAADLALFGRMMADLPTKKRDAACQVAHAFSTNRSTVEFDFYTALDDLKPDDAPGADMMGTVEFNSACYYRYSNVDLEQLWRNLGKDDEAEALARKTVEAFLWASIEAIPTGKQNCSAAQNPPSFILAVVRERGLWSLANAFVHPVRPGPDQSLVRASVAALDSYWGQMGELYGYDGIVGHWFAGTGEDIIDVKKLNDPTKTEVDGTKHLVKMVMDTIAFEHGED